MGDGGRPEVDAGSEEGGAVERPLEGGKAPEGGGASRGAALPTGARSTKGASAALWGALNERIKLRHAMTEILGETGGGGGRIWGGGRVIGEPREDEGESFIYSSSSQVRRATHLIHARPPLAMAHSLGHALGAAAGLRLRGGSDSTAAGRGIASSRIVCRSKTVRGGVAGGRPGFPHFRANACADVAPHGVTTGA